MKKLSLILILLFGFHSLAQDKCRDIIKIASGRRSIVNCCIDTVKNGNIVVYAKKGKTYEVKAIAITKDGERIDLLPEKEKHVYKCKDAVHPTDSRKSILNCCIKEIKPGNIVVYKLGGEIYETEAVAINYKGEYFDLNNNSEIINVVYKDNYPGILYEGHNYAYYDQLYKKANGQMVTGITLATVGLGALIGGAVHMRNYEQEYLLDADEVGTAITLLGLAGIGVGIPIAIVGGVKKPKYKQAMLEIERKAKLSLSTTNHGVGLILKF